MIRTICFSMLAVASIAVGFLPTSTRADSFEIEVRSLKGGYPEVKPAGEIFPSGILTVEVFAMGSAPISNITPNQFGNASASFQVFERLVGPRDSDGVGKLVPDAGIPDVNKVFQFTFTVEKKVLTGNKTVALVFKNGSFVTAVVPYIIVKDDGVKEVQKFTIAVPEPQPPAPIFNPCYVNPPYAAPVKRHHSLFHRR